MIRILHLTDFHLNIKTLKDWDDFYKETFLLKLEEIKNEKEIDLVVFTGDMIDKAGKDFGSVTNGLNKFKENIIDPIIQKLGLDITRFMICPGNHDIDRNADTKMDEIGIKGGLNTVDDINDFINNEEDNYDKINRIKEYKEFEIELYKSIVSDKLHSKFKFSLISEIRGEKIGVSSINSSWRCYGDSDNQNLLIGENQLNDNFKFIKDCDLKIALVHHQFDWLSEIEKSNIKNHFSSNFNLIFSGHVHQTESVLVKNVSGSSLRLISPSGLNNIREDNKNFVNGFSVLDYGDESICYFFKYNHTLKEFVKNTDVCPEGEWIIEVNSSNANSKTSDLILEDDFHDFLYDSGANFTHRSKKLLLDDIYVSPFLEQFSLIEQEERSMSTSLDTTFKKIINNDVPHLIFLGEENSGKTSLCKQLFKQLLSTENVLPVYIKGSDVKKVADKDIENLINRESRKQYKNDWCSPILRKVIIIDDYNNCTLPQKSKKNFLNYLHNSNYQTIVTWDEFFTLSELLESTSVSIEIYEVLKFGVKKRLELIRKWIDLIDEDFQNEQEKEFQINELFKVVNSVIGKNLVPSLPIYILTILQANELTSQTNFEQSTFGHYYDVLIKSAIGQIIKDNKEIEKYYSYLSELSYKIFCSGDYSCELTEDSLIDFHKFFTNQYRLNTSFRDAIETLEKSNLLVKINDSYKFRYKYIYFYFIGKYLSDNIEEEEVRDIVVKLSDKLYQTESANIYIFLSHHSKSKFIINQILERAQELFIDETVIGLNDDISYINSLIEKTTENLDFNNNRSIDEHKTEEYVDINTNISEDITQEDKSYEIDSISKINKAFKTIEIMGYIIKNRYASLKGNDKEVLVEELYKLGLRSLTFLFRSLLEGEEFIKNEIIDIIRKDPNSTLTNREREGLAKQFMFNLLYMVSYSIFKRISTSISSKDLEITFRDVKSKFSDTNNNAVGLIDMAIIFEYSKSFPEANVGELAKDLKSNPFAFSILRRLGVNFMRMMPMKEIDQQKISEMLHISIKNQRFIGATSAISKKSN